MSRLRRRHRSLAILAIAAVLAGGATGEAVAAGGDTSAVAVNTTDGSAVFDLAFSIVRATDQVVNDTNSAVAYASCSVCQTVAISVQIVLIESNPATVTPANYAVAVNQDCNQCDTLATAYQFVVGAGTNVGFSGEGYRRIAEIRRELRALRGSGLSGPEIQSHVDALMTDLGDVLRTDLVTRPGGGPGVRESHGDATRDGGDGSTTDATTTSTPAPPPPQDGSTDTTGTTGTTDTTSTPTPPPPEGGSTGTDTGTTDTTSTAPAQTGSTGTTDTTPAPPPSG
ncbi:MAG: hypothetical protein ACJ77M_04625 [Thermoleophilaceae bacterium]